VGFDWERGGLEPVNQILAISIDIFRGYLDEVVEMVEFLVDLVQQSIYGKQDCDELFQVLADVVIA